MATTTDNRPPVKTETKRGARRRPGDLAFSGTALAAGITILVLQTFAVERSPACGAADKETACTHVTGRPGQVHDSLEPEHGVEDVERDQRGLVVGVAGRRGNP